MAIELNHSIVWSSDQKASANFFADALGLPPPEQFSHFDVIRLDNGVSLDFATKKGPVAPQHYAFLVGDEQFDAGLAWVKARGLSWWADPTRKQPGEINTHWGGRGFYFEAPDGHLLELITKTYGAEEDL